MNYTEKILALAAVGVLAAVLTPRARADAWNQKTMITFSGPVEVPGEVLDPGTYVFKLMDSASDRNVVGVFNKNQTHCYGMFLAIPDYRLEPASRPIITFEERAAGSPEAVKAWFYPGDYYGHEFVYPHVKAQALATANQQPVASMPQETEATTTQPATTMEAPPAVAPKQAPLTAQTETEEQSEITQVLPPPPATEPAQSLPRQLPQTASDLPLIGLLGLASLTSAFLLRWVPVS